MTEPTTPALLTKGVRKRPVMHLLMGIRSVGPNLPTNIAVCFYLLLAPFYVKLVVPRYSNRHNQ